MTVLVGWRSPWWCKVKAISKQNKPNVVIPNLFRDLADELEKESTPSDNQEKQLQGRHPELVSTTVPNNFMKKAAN